MPGRPLLTTIPKEMHVDIWQKYEHGISISSINEYLQSRGIQVHDRTIYRLIKEYREDKQEITKAIYANEVLARAHSDLITVDDMITSLYTNYQERLDNEDHKNAIQYAHALEKYLTFRKNLMSGDQIAADAPKTPLIDQLMEKLLNVTNHPINQNLQESVGTTTILLPPKPNTN